MTCALQLSIISFIKIKIILQAWHNRKIMSLKSIDMALCTKNNLNHLSEHGNMARHYCSDAFRIKNRVLSYELLLKVAILVAKLVFIFVVSRILNMHFFCMTDRIW
jgi:hypothetical protein